MTTETKGTASLTNGHPMPEQVEQAADAGERAFAAVRKNSQQLQELVTQYIEDFFGYLIDYKNISYFTNFPK